MMTPINLRYSFIGVCVGVCAYHLLLPNTTHIEERVVYKEQVKEKVVYKTRTVEKPDGTRIVTTIDTQTKSHVTEMERNVSVAPTMSRYSIGVGKDFGRNVYEFSAGARIGDLPLFLETGFDQNLNRFSFGLKLEF